MVLSRMETPVLPSVHFESLSAKVGVLRFRLKIQASENSMAINGIDAK